MEFDRVIVFYLFNLPIRDTVVSDMGDDGHCVGISDLDWQA